MHPPDSFQPWVCSHSHLFSLCDSCDERACANCLPLPLVESHCVSSSSGAADGMHRNVRITVNLPAEDGDGDGDGDAFG